jgi:hypothetical protein
MVVRPWLVIATLAAACAGPASNRHPDQGSGRPREGAAGSEITVAPAELPCTKASPPTFPAPPGYPVRLARRTATQLAADVKAVLAASPVWKTITLGPDGLLVAATSRPDPSRTSIGCVTAADEAMALGFLRAHPALVGLEGAVPAPACKSNRNVIEQRVGDRVVATVAIKVVPGPYDSATKRYTSGSVGIEGHLWPSTAFPSSVHDDAELFQPWIGTPVQIYTEHGGVAPLGRPGESTPGGFGPGWTLKNESTFSLAQLPALHGVAVLPGDGGLEVREIVLFDHPELHAAACVPLAIDRHTGEDLSARMQAVSFRGIATADGFSLESR